MKEKPKRTKGGNFEAPDFDYIDQMLEWYDENEMDIDLKDFSYTEIQVNDRLYDVYVETKGTVNEKGE